MTIDPARPNHPADTPVFLDASGRRHRRVRTTGWVLAVVVLGYMVLLGISLSASPGFLPFSFGGAKILPNAAAPKIPSARPSSRPLEPPSSPGVNGPAPAGGFGLPTTASRGTSHRTVPTRGPRHAGSLTPRPGTPPPHPTPTHPSHTGKPSAHPTTTHSSQSGKPSAHPTPARTPRSGN